MFSLDHLAAGLTLTLVTGALVAYLVRVLAYGRQQHERIEQIGGSPLLPKLSMEAAIWALRPIVAVCVRLGISAHAITAFALALGLLAGVSVGLGHFGVASLLALISSLLDSVDGFVARATGTASLSGKIFDAAADRYNEAFLIGGAAYWLRSDDATVVAAFSALVGSFMVSYASAKAEALKIEIPRGWFRRQERAAFMVLAVWASALWPQTEVGSPLLWVFGVLAVGANFCAIHRLSAIADANVSTRAEVRFQPPPPAPRNNRLTALLALSQRPKLKHRPAKTRGPTRALT